MMKCTLVTPLRNERDNVELLWRSIMSQSRLPDEWIITDNGSTDGTYEWLVCAAITASLPVKVCSYPGETIAGMLNSAIESAEHDIIACCHGGTRIPFDWLEQLLVPFEHDGAAVSCGVWESYGETTFEKWVATRLFFQEIENLDESNYLPASRSLAFARHVWRDVKGFPEWLPKFGEDTLFAIKLHTAAFKIVIARKAMVGWRQKSSVRALLTQYLYYSEADACIGTLRFNVLSAARLLCFIMVFILGCFFSGFYTGAAFFLTVLVLDMVRQLAKYSIGFSEYLILVVCIPAAKNLGYLKGKLQLMSGAVIMPEDDRKAVAAYTYPKRTNSSHSQ